MKRILLIGRNGQIGFELRRALAPLAEVVAVGRADCDLADGAALRALVRAQQPDVIVNAAAYTAVDRAETDAEQALAVNGRAPGILGEEAARLGAWVIHYSTDCVFDGTKADAYTEADLPNPLGVYGRSKREGELALQASGARQMILRSSWVVGAHGGNFAKTILRVAAERDSLDVVADQFGAPTSAALLADVTAQIVGRVQREGADAMPDGLFHVAAGGATSWCDYARFVVARAIAAGRPLRLAPDRIRAITTAEYPLPAPRPANCRLDTTHFRETFGLRLPDWRIGVGHVLEQILQ
jgi:dTDP-4-dehydrorhamnose reductase